MVPRKTGSSWEELLPDYTHNHSTTQKREIIMTASTIEQVLENIYTSLQNDNEDIDTHIQDLKVAMAAGSQKSVEVDSARLVQNNRSGRKLMQSYFKKRGVIVTFSEKS
jgi:hypothetical protein